MFTKNMTFLQYINSENRGFFLPDMGTNGLFLINKKAYEVYDNPNLQLKLAKTMDEYFESDFIYAFCDGITFSEVLGLETLRPDYDFPSVLNHPITDSQKLRKLTVPNPYTDGRLPLNIESLSLISKNFDKPLYESIQGPFTLAGQLMGATHLLRCIITDKKFVEEILEFTCELVRRYAVAANKAGAKYISIAEPTAVTLNNSRFNEYVVKHVNKIYDELDCWKGMHICGDTRELLGNMLGCNIDAISLDQILDYEEIAPQIPSDIVLIGNIDPIKLHRSTPKDIEKDTFKFLKKMRKFDNFLCDFGCNCLNNTPVENLQSAIKAGRIHYDKLDRIDINDL